MDPIEPPQEGPHDRRGGRPEHRPPPGDPTTAELRQQLAEALQRLRALEDWKANLTGHNGIDINGSAISFNKRAAGIGNENGTSGLVFTILVNGGLANVFFPGAQFTG